MRLFFSWTFVFILWASQLPAQQNCATSDRIRQQLDAEPGLRQRLESIAAFAQANPAPNTIASKDPVRVITIPVVVHILYHTPDQNITNQQVYNQLKVLNECFRRLNADTVNTPERFRSRAADAGFEFKLAISDPRRRSTTGIIRKYTPVTTWGVDDLVKFSKDAGDDAWDSRKYLNIWVCNLGRIAGYSSSPGEDPSIDGIVMSASVFGTTEGGGMGKTTVHEVGHWLGLKHIWGDAYCGDDGIDDTPKQGNVTLTCPASGFKSSCDNGPDGDMYMNYMDLTTEVCTNMFTAGQAAHMRALFAAGGVRNGILTSTGLQVPLISEIPVAEPDPTWLYANLYPNPASTEVTIDFSFDIRWMGKALQVSNSQGQVVASPLINAKKMTIDVSSLKPGYYFVSAKKEDGARIQLKFVKM